MGFIATIIRGIVGFLQSIMKLFAGSRRSMSDDGTRKVVPPTQAQPPSAGGSAVPSPKTQPPSLSEARSMMPPSYGAPPVQQAPGMIAPPPPPSRMANPEPEESAKQKKERSFKPEQMPATPVERSMALDDLIPGAAGPAFELHAPPPEITDSEESQPQARAMPESGPAIPTENVRFTAYYPKEAAVETWYTLLVYAYIESALDAVRKDAARFSEDMANVPKESSAADSAKLARDTEITIVPSCDGVTFNPERCTLKWVEDRHRAEFRFKADKSLAGDAGKGLITVYVGPLIIATLKFALLFSDTEQSTSAPVAMRTPQEVTSQIYKQEAIFVSYSHNDTSVVIACRDAYKALGYDVLIDVDNLRAGQHWSDELKRMIDRADIFQLFWSSRSAQSDYVRQEWQYALKRETKEGFIRPVYWEKPLTPPPPELSALHFAYVPLATDKEP